MVHCFGKLGRLGLWVLAVIWRNYARILIHNYARSHEMSLASYYWGTLGVTRELPHPMKMLPVLSCLASFFRYD